MPDMIYEMVDGQPMPRLPFVAGQRIEADGVRFFSIEQAASRFNVPEKRLRENWLAIWSGILGASPEPAADARLESIESPGESLDSLQLEPLEYPRHPAALPTPARRADQMFVKIGNVVLNLRSIVRVTLRVRDRVDVETSNHLMVFDGAEARAVDSFFSSPANVVDLISTEPEVKRG